VAEAKSAFIFTLETIFISTGLILMSFVASKVPQIVPLNLTRLGLVTGVLGYMVFLLEVSSLTVYTKQGAYAFGVAFAAWGFVLLPLWIVYLAVVLGREHQDPNAPPPDTRTTQLLETEP
jgi:hypothetical protein